MLNDLPSKRDYRAAALPEPLAVANNLYVMHNTGEYRSIFPVKPGELLPRPYK